MSNTVSCPHSASKNQYLSRWSFGFQIRNCLGSKIIPGYRHRERCLIEPLVEVYQIKGRTQVIVKVSFRQKGFSKGATQTMIATGLIRISLMLNLGTRSHLDRWWN